MTKLRCLPWMIALAVIALPLLHAEPDGRKITLQLKVEKGQIIRYDALRTTQSTATLTNDGGETTKTEYSEVRSLPSMEVMDVSAEGEVKAEIWYPQFILKRYTDAEHKHKTWTDWYCAGILTSASYDETGAETYRDDDDSEWFACLFASSIHARINAQRNPLALDIDAGCDPLLFTHRTLNNDFLVLPAGEVTVGDTWTGSCPAFDGYNFVAEDMRVSLTFTLANIAAIDGKTVARIDVAGANTWKDKSFSSSEYGTDYSVEKFDDFQRIVHWESLAQTLKGYYRVDASTGLILDAALEVTIDDKHEERGEYQGQIDVDSRASVVASRKITMTMKPAAEGLDLPTIDDEDK